MLLAYGISWQGTPLPDRAGVGGHPLAWVVVSDLAVLVEPGLESTTLESWDESQWLAAALAHAAVVQGVFAKATILPIALRSGFFADVAPIYGFLQNRGPHLAERLRFLAGCGEATVRAVPGTSSPEVLTGRAYFAAKRERWQSLEALQKSWIAHSVAYRIRQPRDEEALRLDLLLTLPQWQSLRAELAGVSDWRVTVGDWLPPYSFVEADPPPPESNA